ncbi:hypothetical protein [Nonomuraea sp. NPDC050786]|uniref:hypothetical protein n=1 Tax=Nonomuraea sp. NPDC050786 TaxID=3154840 RepID=UPI003408CA36
MKRSSSAKGTPRALTTSTPEKIRSDIREYRQGVRLRIAVKLRDSETCKPSATRWWRAGTATRPGSTRAPRRAPVTKEDGGYLGVIVFAADSDKDGS